MDTKWQNFIEGEKQRPYFQNVEARLERERNSASIQILPPRERVYQAFEDVAVDDVKVVILGQDPYHGVGQAIGRAFAVDSSCAIPPSLRNIFKEIESEMGACHADRTLSSWANQGVFLLNAALTVQAHNPASHSKIGWDLFTDHAIKYLNAREGHIVFMLWGNFAKSKAYLIDNPNHLVLMSAHPSPLAANRGFFGNGHFKRANEFLAQNGLEPINW